MEHVVFSAAVDGAGEEFRRVSSLEEAVRVVEHLRNDLGIEESSVFALTPVPLAFKTYYRVEVPGGDAAVAPVSDAPAFADDALVPPLAAVQPPEDSVPHLQALPDLGADIPDLEAPAMATPLLPRASEMLGDSVTAGEAEHSLGYFTR